MATRSGPHFILEWQSTLGAMRRCGTRVRWSCPTCNRWGDADVGRLIQLLGEEGSLWDRTPPCEAEGCTGQVRFFASPGAATPFRPMRTDGITHPPPPPEHVDMAGWSKPKA